MAKVISLDLEEALVGERDNRPSYAAVVVPLGEGKWTVYDYVGSGVEWHVNSYGVDVLDDIDPPRQPGLWIWTGWIYSKRFDTADGPEWDLVTEGTWRRPSNEESQAVCSGRPVWRDQNILPSEGAAESADADDLRARAEKAETEDRSLRAQMEATLDATISAAGQSKETDR